MMKTLPMIERASGTMVRADKGPVAPPPLLDGPLGTVAAAVAEWPGIVATVHWDLFQPTVVDGIDFYLGEEELGHMHLDGDVHLATSAKLGAALVKEGAAKPFRWQRGWVHAYVQRIGAEAAVALFRRNYDRLKLGD
jgi:hypothetical protein